LAITLGSKAVREGVSSLGRVRLWPHTQGLLLVLLTTPTTVERRPGKCARGLDGIGRRRECDDGYEVEEHEGTLTG